MKSKSLFARRPSPSLVIASLALFVSLGGGAYAAASIPDNSVGSAQLKHHAVTSNKLDFLSVGFRKIQLGAVGTRRINNDQVQERVSGTCAANSAIASVDNQGAVKCNPTGPAELSTSTSSPVTLGTSATTIKSLNLAAGSPYLVSATPQLDVSNTTGTKLVTVNCTLAVAPGDSSTTVTRSATFQPGPDDQMASLSLTIPAPAAGNGSSATVSCTQSSPAGTPKTSVATSINAIQTASNTSS
ncbi:MAG: hypothetical protein QOI43_3071 [Gaiellales bacterium]|nr:hypothetical protein [Gaiellales bacterium]